MAFVNIKKVRLENTNEIKEALADVVLLYASIVHDAVKANNRKSAEHNLIGLDCATKNLLVVLDKGL